MPFWPDDGLNRTNREERQTCTFRWRFQSPLPRSSVPCRTRDPQQFVIGLLTQSLEGGLDEDQWWQLLEEIDSVAVDTGVSDLAERHDHYLGAL